MIPTIGLIITVYAVARLVQVPLESTMLRDRWLGMPQLVRWLILVAVSGIAILVLLLLALSLLLPSGSFSSGPSAPPQLDGRFK